MAETPSRTYILSICLHPEMAWTEIESILSLIQGWRTCASLSLQPSSAAGPSKPACPTFRPHAQKKPSTFPPPHIHRDCTYLGDLFFPDPGSRSLRAEHRPVPCLGALVVGVGPQPEAFGAGWRGATSADPAPSGGGLRSAYSGAEKGRSWLIEL